MDIASKLVELVIDVIDVVRKLIVPHVAYVVFYGQNVEELNGSVEDLRHKRLRVERRVAEATRNLQNTEDGVKNWFEKVEEFTTDNQKFQNDEGRKKTQWYNLMNRYRLGKQAKKMAEDVKKLIDESSKFNEVAYWQNVTSNDATLSIAGYVELGSRKSLMEDIMAKLEDSTVRMIGLYGTGGVGKSTLIKAIAKKARDKKLFNVVAISEITANPNLLKIQNEIAYVLGLRLEVEGENARADCLRRRLRKEKENTLVILDDLWDRLDLNKLGIPLDDEDEDDDGGGDDDEDDDGGGDNDQQDPKGKSNDQRHPKGKMVKKEKFLGDYKGCKILLTSRDKNVLSGKMDVRMPDKYEALRSLALQLKDRTDNIHSQKGIKLLFKRVENLLLGELNGVQNVIYELNLHGFPVLKHLSIASNNGIKYFSSMDLCHPQEVFPNLESLCLYELRNIEMIICCSLVTKASFAKLKTIKVKMCTRLKNLFSFYMVKFLSSLESIDVSECNSLKEIVEIPENSDKEIVEIPENSYKVEFLKLHSLTLQSLLPSFTSFYTGPSVPQMTKAQATNMDHIEITIAEGVASLFGELVEIPNLVSLNLFSINGHKIWRDQPLSSFCFQNLIKLVVKECDELRYLCSFSVVCGLRKLKSLFVSGCQMMEMLFSTEGNMQVCVFPKLEEMHLSKMKMLTDIWQAEVSADSFSSLISVHIEDCEKLDKIFPSYMEAWFASLDSLKVVNCKSVEVIFEINDSQQMDALGGIDTNLQRIFVRYLPNLKQVWSRDPRGILNFKELRSIQVSFCRKLRNVFPASVAKDVPKLEHISVQWSKQMVEIVAWEDGSEINNDPLVFPELTEVTLYSLANIKHFYEGSHTIKCPKLKRLTVKDCKKLKAFPTETRETTNEEEKAVFSAEKVIPNLEYMEIGSDEAQKWLWINSEKYQMHRLKDLSLSLVKSADLLYQFLYRMPNLEKLSILMDIGLKS
ncbi:disease resistance protein [Spatholobus suberectus]|nr:disease resistance protein [Spatholobus suberectus]